MVHFRTLMVHFKTWVRFWTLGVHFWPRRGPGCCRRGTFLASRGPRPRRLRRGPWGQGVVGLGQSRTSRRERVGGA
eukprot:1733935-Rhodomonas_salina.1